MVDLKGGLEERRMRKNVKKNNNNKIKKRKKKKVNDEDEKSMVRESNSPIQFLTYLPLFSFLFFSSFIFLMCWWFSCKKLWPFVAERDKLVAKEKADF